MKKTPAQREVLQVRNFYRKNFRNGEIDECFLIWIKDILDDLHNIGLLDTIPEYIPGNNPMEGID